MNVVDHGRVIVGICIGQATYSPADVVLEGRTLSQPGFRRP